MRKTSMIVGSLFLLAVCTGCGKSDYAVTPENVALYAQGSSENSFFQLFDAAINHGIGNAIRMLQRAVGVADDGVVGKITLGAINEKTLDDVLVLFNAERLEFYSKLKTFDTFGRGWSRRVVSNLRYAAGDTP